MKLSDKPWRTLSSKAVYQNPWMKVFEDKVLSFRYPTQKGQWELPTGGIEKGTSSLESAKSELVEKLYAGEEHHEDFEAIRAVKSCTLKEIMTMIKDGSLADGQSLAALMQFVAWRGIHGL